MLYFIIRRNILCVYSHIRRLLINLSDKLLVVKSCRTSQMRSFFANTEIPFFELRGSGQSIVLTARVDWRLRCDGGCAPASGCSVRISRLCILRQSRRRYVEWGGGGGGGENSSLILVLDLNDFLGYLHFSSTFLEPCSLAI